MTIGHLDLFKTVRDALLTGGTVLKKWARRRVQVSFKTPTSPVTQADRESEKKIIALIRRRFPEHTFLAEESAFLKEGDLGPSRADRYRWVIDPLDGTVNFMHGVPQACVSVAVERNGRVLAGGIYDSFRDELFLARRGGGATLNGRRIRVSPVPTLKRAMLVTGFPYDRSKRAKTLANSIRPFFERGIDIRRFGAAALDLAWVACGRCDGFWEYNLNPWDVAAGWLLVEEAGGKVTDFDGRPFRLDFPGRLLATNRKIHPPMVAVLSLSHLNRVLRKT